MDRTRVPLDSHPVKPWELEQLRRSVAMLPPGHSAGALSREQALTLFEEIATLDQRSRRYEEVLAELRRVLRSVDDEEPEKPKS